MCLSTMEQGVLPAVTSEHPHQLAVLLQGSFLPTGCFGGEGCVWGGGLAVGLSGATQIGLTLTL